MGPVIFEDDIYAPQPLRPHEIKIRVQATRIRCRDVQVINGKLPDQSHDQECAGIIIKVGTGVTNLSVGDRIAAWCVDTFGTHARLSARLAHKIPDAMSFEVAASLSVAYTIIYYSLLHVSRLEAGETILIHEAVASIG